MLDVSKVKQTKFTICNSMVIYTPIFYVIIILILEKLNFKLMLRNSKKTLKVIEGLHIILK